MGGQCTGKDSTKVHKSPDKEANIKKVIEQDSQLSKKQFQYDLSRLVACHGVQVQKKLMKMKVFVHGLTGVGIQVVKNLILMGPEKVAIYDKNLISMSDVGNNFYLNQSLVQKQTRVSGCISKLKELNNRSQIIEAHTDKIDQIIKNYNCVVVLDNYDRNYLIKLNQACRINQIPFILGGNLGLYGYAFVDFGQNHQIFDASGRQPRRLMIKSISKQRKGIVAFHEQDWHGFSSGDKARIINVKGMTEVNQKQFEVTINQENTNIQINVDTSQFAQYLDGGQLIQIKKIIPLSFRGLQQALRNPCKSNQDQMISADWSKNDHPFQLHNLLNSIYQFYAKKNRIPKLLDSNDEKQFLQTAKEHLGRFKQQMQAKKMDTSSLNNLNIDLASKISNFGSIQISSSCSFWGGIITQQIIKSTGKYKPIYQWFHHDFIDLIPNIQRNIKNVSSNRYKDYEILFGKEFVQKCLKLNLFVVGAGALGCQYIKMFALMGLGSGKGGNIWVTDDDEIQTSNLNRQFLFRESHIGKLKSQIACQIGKSINPQTNFHSLKLRLTPQTSYTLNDKFWDGLKFVVNAVDNVQARNTIDDKCVFYQKACFQSGTSGTSCSSQIIIPHKTATYSDMGQPKKQQLAPSCTIKNTPYKIQHIIPWTKGLFQIIFQSSSQNFIDFHKSKESFLTKITEKVEKSQRQLKILKNFLILSQEKSYQKCVQYFLTMLNELFRQKIKKLLKLFPQDMISRQTEKPYWSGVNKCPQVLQFNLSDEYQLNFVKGGSNILSDFFKIGKRMDSDAIIRHAKNLIQKTSSFEGQKFSNRQQSRDQLLKFLRNYQFKEKIQLIPIYFDKDNPTNFHIQFLSAATNLRAKNYKIQQLDNLKIKIIAGKIIPAIATTTAMVVGHIGIQIIKYILHQQQGNFMNLSANLSIPDWSFARPLQKQSLQDKQKDEVLLIPKKYLPKLFNKWYKIQINHSKTLKQLNIYIQNEFKQDIYNISGQGISLSQQQIKQFQDKDLKQLFQAKTQKKFDSSKKWLRLQIWSKDKDGTTYFYPTIKYKLS